MSAAQITNELRARRAALAASPRTPTHPLAETIRARRDALAAQLEQGKAEYQQVEDLLVNLQRNLDAMHGGLQELDALLVAIDQEGTTTS